jgi:hypothetical protein
MPAPPPLGCGIDEGDSPTAQPFKALDVALGVDPQTYRKVRLSMLHIFSDDVTPPHERPGCAGPDARRPNRYSSSAMFQSPRGNRRR